MWYLRGKTRYQNLYLFLFGCTKDQTFSCKNSMYVAVRTRHVEESDIMGFKASRSPRRHLRNSGVHVAHKQRDDCRRGHYRLVYASLHSFRLFSRVVTTSRSPDHDHIVILTYRQHFFLTKKFKNQIFRKRID